MDFLKVDLELAFTFLQTAAIDANDDTEHANLALSKAQAALDMIMTFQIRIEDPRTQQNIQRRSDELQKAIEAFKRSRESIGMDR